MLHVCDPCTQEVNIAESGVHSHSQFLVSLRTTWDTWDPISQKENKNGVGIQEYIEALNQMELLLLTILDGRHLRIHVE